MGNDIGFKSAPGCNAQAVVDYVLSAVSVLLDQRGIGFTDLSVGIVGIGNVGSLLRTRLEALGTKVLAVDPFKDEEEVGELVSLDEALQADVVTLHTPLTRDGEHGTYHLIDEARLKQMKPDACLINSSRGPVVDNAANPRKKSKKKIKSQTRHKAIKVRIAKKIQETTRKKIPETDRRKNN